ncbi:NAD(P)-dependent dehydrogenase (short-subunit alcohol dehydrogenase family) [Pedobacter sp. UYEF25]
MRKNVIITGTSSGLGLETSILAAEKGFKVFATMRDLSKAENLKLRMEAGKFDIELFQLDVTDNSSVLECIKKIVQKGGKIDALINNAGAGFPKTTEQATEEELKWVTDLNYFGVVRCTKAVLPIMRRQKSGRIINISSVGGLVGQPFNELYCAAKFAVEGYTESMATYVQDYFGIKFSLVEPGGVITEFINSAMKKTGSNGSMTLPEYQPVFQKYMDGVQKRAAAGKENSYQTARQVAEVILKVLEAENPPLRIRTSEWAEEFCKYKTAQDPTGNDQTEAIKTRFLR